MRNRLAGQPLTAAPGRAVAVTAVSGCVMLIRRGVRDGGPVRRGVFLLVRGCGLLPAGACGGIRMSICVPGARAYHEGGASIGRRSPRRVYFATRNHLRLAAGSEPRRATGGVLARAFVAGLNTAYVVTSPDAPLAAGLAAVVRGDLASPARALWPRPGRVARGVAHPAARGPRPDARSAGAAARRRPRSKRDDEDKEDQHEDQHRRRVVDPEQPRGQVQRVAPERENQQRHGADATRSASILRSACAGGPARAPGSAARR